MDNTELTQLNQALDELLNPEPQPVQSFNWGDWETQACDDYDNYDEYDDEEYDPTEGDYYGYADAIHRERHFYALHHCTQEEYTNQINTMYSQYGNPSLYHSEELDYKPLIREVQIQNIIMEGIKHHHLTLPTLLHFCDTYLTEEEGYRAVKFYCKYHVI